jgi:hypothetical protein
MSPQVGPRASAIKQRLGRSATRAVAMIKARHLSAAGTSEGGLSHVQHSRGAGSQPMANKPSQPIRLTRYGKFSSSE